MNTPQFRFGENEVDPATRQVTHAGRSLRTEPKVFDVLVLLLRQRHRVVTKQELLDTVWGRMVVTDGVIARTVMKARKLIGEYVDNTRSVRALRRIGFRRIPVRRPSDKEGLHYMALKAPGVEVDALAVLIDHNRREDQPVDFEPDPETVDIDGGTA